MRANAWLPAALLVAGAILVQSGTRQQRVPLAMPLDGAVPLEIDALAGEDLEVSAEEREATGMSSYIFRMYRPEEGTDPAKTATAAAGFSLYVGYYDSQTQGKTIHSPRNCLPGAGWEPLTSSMATIVTSLGAVTVNRYVLQNEGAQMLALYWYQGRGRVAANEYRVKWDLLRDAALRGRTEEALVRILVPIETTEEAAFEVARRAATTVLPAVHRALPGA